MTTEFESTISIQTAGLKGEIRLVNILDGTIYNLPEGMVDNKGNNRLVFKNIPITDYPLLLTFGDFI